LTLSDAPLWSGFRTTPLALFGGIAGEDPIEPGSGTDPHPTLTPFTTEGPTSMTRNRNTRNHLTPAQNALRGSIGGHLSWARTSDRTARTATARANSPASLTYWERQIDPDGVMDPAERHTRAGHLHRAHFRQLAFRSSVARSNAARARVAADDLDADAETIDQELLATADPATLEELGIDLEEPGGTAA
jgi:hypothetical protein